MHASSSSLAVVARWATTAARQKWIIVGFCFGIALIRLAYVAWQLETAPGVLATLLREATVGWLGQKYQPITEADPRAQAEYWISEADRIVGAERTSEMARGAPGFSMPLVKDMNKVCCA